MKKLLLFVFVGLPFLLAIAIGAVVVTGIEDRPRVTTSETVDARSVARGKALALAYRESLLKPNSLTTLSASEADLNRMLALAGRGMKIAAFDTQIRPTGMLVSGSVRLPKTPLGRYFNGWIGFVPSTNGLRIDTARIGRLEIPGWIVLAAMRMGLDGALGKGRGDEALASIREVDFAPKQIRVTYRPTPQLIADLQRTAKDAYRQVVIDIDPGVVRLYYVELVKTGKANRSRADVPFTAFLGSMITLARARSSGGDAATENAAAIIAMAIYFGDNRFERIIGDVRTGELAGKQPKTNHVKLRGRHDLVQHFTISAALTVTAGLGISDVIGELKEVQDTGKGGSGFSFTDIAADRAGARFGETATSASGADWVQKLLGGAPLENMFFPSIAGLPEFMPRAEFVRRYGSVGSADYGRVVRDIDLRLSKLAIFGR